VVKKTIEELVEKAYESMGASAPDFTVEHPTDMNFGDYSTNAALVGAKVLGKNPKDLADELIKYFKDNKPADIERVDIAGPGFINFYLAKEFFVKSIQEILEKDGNFGKNTDLDGEKTMVEYTDPNVMKPFHIGHLMSNTIGEALSRIVEWNGAQVIRANYYSDSGLNIAKAVWGMKAKKSEMPSEAVPLSERAKFLGMSYAYGVSQAEDENVSTEIKEINKKIFDKSDSEVNELYDLGKRWSLDYFAELYARLGSKFDWIIGESEIAEKGKKIVEDNTGTIFEISEGATVFKGEKYAHNLHTRVFINKEGLPTYEAKELGLTKEKFDKFNLDRSIVITANEQNDYFKVVLAAIDQVIPTAINKTDHISHGIMRLPTGKMSSRT
jgi:arginyl-tRNA synthetase